jgi:hypothetical protein
MKSRILRFTEPEKIIVLEICYRAPTFHIGAHEYYHPPFKEISLLID